MFKNQLAMSSAASTTASNVTAEEGSSVDGVPKPVVGITHGEGGGGGSGAPGVTISPANVTVDNASTTTKVAKGRVSFFMLLLSFSEVVSAGNFLASAV